MNFRYSASGFRQDQEELFTRFNLPIPEAEGQSANEISLRFIRFSELWQEMHFSLIFRLRQNENDLREFVDEIYLEVLPFVGSEYPLARRVCALYLLYALFVKQPAKIRQKIRINYQFLEQIRELIQRCKQLEQLDVCFIWYKLLALGAIDLVHVSRLMGPYYIRNLRVTNERLTETDFIIDQFKAAIYEPINELSQIHEKYRTIKDNLVDRNPQMTTECHRVEDNIFELFKTKEENLHKEFFSNNLSQLLMGSESQESDDLEDKKFSEDIGSKRRKLREKASGFGDSSQTVRQQLMAETEEKEKKKPKPMRGRPKLARLYEVQ